MHESQDFLRTLALVLGVAAVTTVLFQRLRLPVVFGYMLAGLVIGPHVPIPLVADQDMVHTLSELGVILLMFSLGLEFSFRGVVRSGWSILVIATLQSSLMLWLGYQAGRLLGWSVLASLYGGAAISVSSTTIVAKAFAEQRVRGKFRDLVFGILIVQDLIAILLLALLTPASTPGESRSLALTVVRLVAVLAGFLAAGMLLVPRLARFVVAMGRAEITLVVSIGICFVMALLVREIGYSVALGAFLAGSLIAESGEGGRIETLVEPVRDMFVAIFFVSVGMMIVPADVAAHWREVLGGTLLVLVGAIGAVSVATFLTGAGIRTAVQTGMSLGQIGEFSFILAGVGLASGAASPALQPIVVAVSAITTLTTPWLIRVADPAAAAIDRRLPRSLQTFAALYGSWIENVRSRPATSAEQDRLRRAVRALALDACVIAALAVGASVAARPLGARLAAGGGLDPFRARALVSGAAVLLSIPFLVAIVRTSRILAQIVATRAFPLPPEKRVDMAAAPRRALVVAIQLTVVLVVGAPLAAVTQPFLPPFAGVGVLLAGVAVLGLVVWRSAADLQGHVRAAAEAIVSAIGQQSRGGASGTAEAALERAYQVLPGLGEPVPVGIEAGSPFAGRTLAAIALRGRTGATIIAISRGGEVVLVPDGHEVLRPGDVVALAGTRASIEAARHLLARGEEIAGEEVVAPEV